MKFTNIYHIVWIVRLKRHNHIELRSFLHTNHLHDRCFIRKKEKDQIIYKIIYLLSLSWSTPLTRQTNILDHASFIIFFFDQSSFIIS